MNMQSEKLRLLRMLIDTEDEDLLKHLHAVFELHKNGDLWEDLPAEVKVSVQRGLLQSERNEVISHKQVMKKHGKWLKG